MPMSDCTLPLWAMGFAVLMARPYGSGRFVYCFGNRVLPSCGPTCTSEGFALGAVVRTVFPAQPLVALVGYMFYMRKSLYCRTLNEE